MERHRVAVLGLPVLVITLLLLSVITSFMLRKNPSLPEIETRLGLAKAHYQEQDFAQAITVLKDLESKAIQHPQVLVMLANAYYRSEEYAEAEAYYRRVEDQQNPMYLHNLGQCLYRQGKRDEALVVFKQVLEQFGADYPDLAKKVTLAVELIEPKSSAQPKHKKNVEGVVRQGGRGGETPGETHN